MGMFSNGSEFADWQEAWCFRCKHDHEMHEDTGPGCEIVLRMFADDPTPEIVRAGYRILFEQGTHDIPPVSNSLPAALFCTKFELCEPGCREHVNGAIITGHEIGEAW